MAVVLQGGLIVLLALVTLVTAGLVVAVRRLTHMRWQPVRSHPVARDDVPASIRATLDRPAAELAQLGFAYRYSGVTNKMLVTLQNEPVFFDVYQHCDRHTHAMVSPSPVPEPQQPCMLQLITCLDDGNNWLTLNRSRHYSPIDLARWHTVDDYLPQWTQAWHRHLQRVQSTRAPICLDAVEVHRRLRQAFEDLVPQLQQQGKVVPVPGSHGHFRLTTLAAAQMAVKVLGGQLRAAWSAPTAKANSTPDAQAALPTQQQGLDADLRAFQDQLATSRATTSSSKSKWITFAVTAVLFLLVGGLWFSWAFVPIVLAVVALHEGGHYLAMKLTGFRNVSVFFVPGLGGLATGEKATATPFEKLFVYLAGPVPGIALAGIAFWASASGYWTGPGWLTEFLVASLVINYLNLLPLMPLDGGRVLETLVFARHPRLRFGFAAICCALLFGLGTLLDDTVLRVVAVLIAFGLPYQWRRMQLDLAVPRDGNAALDEPQALQSIFGALQQARFQSWSFAKRTAAATALLPELMGRRASATESVVGVVIYTLCLLAPLGAAFVAAPHLAGAMVSAFAPGQPVAPDDVDPEPAGLAATPPIDSSITTAATRLSLARALDAQGDTAGAEAQLQKRVDDIPLPAPHDRSRQALGRRVHRVVAGAELAWFMTGHGRAAEARQVAAQALAEVPATTTVSWLMPRQQALEAQVWSMLLSQQPTPELATQWEAYDATRRVGFGADQKLLFHEVDRALVAQVLHDAGLMAQASAGIAEAMARRPKHSTTLCSPPQTGTTPNWRAPQHAARQRMLTELGHCRASVH
ncbi:MAG: site-2 protease family protein [Pseudomonadota bacterium]